MSAPQSFSTIKAAKSRKIASFGFVWKTHTEFRAKHKEWNLQLKIYFTADSDWDFVISAYIFHILELCKKSILTNFEPMSTSNSKLFCGISCIMVHSLEVKGNISLMMIRESWVQTFWWHFKAN